MSIRAHLRDITRRLTGLRPRDTQVPRCFDNNYWYEGIQWEPTVRYALEDVLRAGDTAFDCGANIGGLTTVMSRRVGPKGTICAFEASPRIVGFLQHNLSLQGCFNTWVYHRAVHSTTGRALNIKFNLQHHHSDRITSGAGDTAVVSLALDDFIDETGLVPALVKMDIEGSELEALRGFARSIGSHHPHLILEMTPSDPATFEWVMERGYKCWDLETYRTIATLDDFDIKDSLRNVLYVHSSKIDTVPYSPGILKTVIAKLDSGSFTCHSDGSAFSDYLEVPEGRHIFEMDFEARGTSNTMICGLQTEAATLFAYQTHTSFLASSYRNWIIHLDAPVRLRAFFRFLDGTSDGTFVVRGGTVCHLPELSRKTTLT
jgi:FkbM family methyltransferase